MAEVDTDNEQVECDECGRLMAKKIVNKIMDGVYVCDESLRKV